MVVALAVVVLTTGVILAHHASNGDIRWEETTEEPLMAGIFVVMVWHVYRRQLLLREVERIHELERRWLERQQLLVRLASHELRTPITVARGYTELVRAADAGNEALQQDTAVVIDELDKVAGITQRLVTLMQLDHPHLLQRVDIDAELLRIVRRWEPTAERHWDVGSVIGYVFINPDRFEAALDSLLENAVKFTSCGDSIRITGERYAGGWAVHVRDSGCGISAQTASRLMQADSAQASQTGTGLGLAIVRAVVEPLGGRLVISGEPGVGTLVTMQVPWPATAHRNEPRPEVVIAEPVHDGSTNVVPQMPFPVLP
jgi:signal transduction histidine kinase